VLVSAGAIGAAVAVPAGGVDRSGQRLGPGQQNLPRQQGQPPQVLRSGLIQDGVQLPTLPVLTLDPTTRRT
jgi:hypothetical protein